VEKSSSTESKCERCLHFRPQAAFVDAWKRLDVAPPRKEMMESLKEVRRAETEALEHEVELLFELVRGECLEWSTTPRFAPFCAFDEKVYIAAIKNRGGRCESFELARDRDHRACLTCEFMVGPPRYIGDRHEDLQGWMNEGTRNHVTQQNKDKADADAAAKGLEIEQAFYSESRLPVVQFLPTCGSKRASGLQHVVPFCNLRHDCIDHKGRIDIPDQLLKTDRGPVDPVDERADPRAVEMTVRLVAEVANFGIADPDGFLGYYGSISEQGDYRDLTLGWVRRGLVRWASVSNRSGLSLGALAQTIRPPQLHPVIAGVNAFEWGWVAERSRKHPEMVAKAMSQQLAEFLAAVVQPLEGVKTIESFQSLVASGVFAPATIGFLDTFLRRLEIHRNDLLHMARTNLPLYYEVLLTKLLYSTTHWLRLQLEQGSGPGGALGMTIGEDSELKVADAKDQARWLLEQLAGIEEGVPKLPAPELLRQLEELNKAALGADMDAQIEFFRNLFSGLGVDPSLGTMGGAEGVTGALGMLGIKVPQQEDIPTQSVRQVFGSRINVEAPSRQMAAWLMLQRGAAVVTPSVIELKSGRPARSVSTSIERALSQPASKNLEAYFVAPADDVMLARSRRIGSPRIV
jgi:hypothetical protein